MIFYAAGVFIVAVMYGGVFGKDGNAAFALDGVAVHDALLGHLIFAVNASLLEHFVDKGRFAVVDVGYDGDVS